MKILFINISDIKGGSAKAAFNLGKYLSDNFDAEILYLVRSKYSQNSNVIQTRANRFQEYFEKAINIVFNSLGLQYRWLPFSSSCILNTAAEFKPDIISLHNTIGGYFQTDLIKELSMIAPLFWTFHDMWPITANAANTFGHHSFLSNKSFKKEKYIYPQIGSFPLQNPLSFKETIYSKTDFSVVTPSKWLFDLAGQSPVLKGKSLIQINNGIDPNIYHLKENLKKTGRPVILVVAEKFKNNFKFSHSDFFELLKLLNEQIDFEIDLHLLGDNQFNFPVFNFIKIKNNNYIENEKKLAKLYQRADICLYPSLADNLPNVPIESIMCGTPCIAYAVGGIPEIVRDGITGYCFSSNNKKEMIKKIVELLKNRPMLTALSKSSRNFAVQNFSIEHIAKTYFDLFKKNPGHDSRDKI